MWGPRGGATSCVSSWNRRLRLRFLRLKALSQLLRSGWYSGYRTTPKAWDRPISFENMGFPCGGFARVSARLCTLALLASVAGVATCWGAAAQEGAVQVKAAMGDTHGVWLKADGSVWTWGENEYGELGNGTTRDSPRPVQAAGLTGVLAVAARAQHILALRSDGTVWAWGDDPASSASPLPKQVAGLSGVVAIATSERHHVALKSDGTVWIWGDHGAGDLGNGTYGVSSAPMQVPGLAGITAVAAGYQLTLALRNDGTVWTLGYGAAGQLGNGSKESSTKPVMVSGLSGIKAVAAGYMHALALKADGTLWSWGYNHEGQLGNFQLQAEESARPVRSGTLSGVVAIAASASHSVAVDSHGIVWAWGQNDGGSLGADAELLERSDVPMRVGQSVPAECNPLFSCQTASGNVIRICGTQDPAEVDKWSDIQYRFGPANGPPELMYPEDPAEAKPSLFFSHEEKEGDYRVSIRFSNGAYNYRVYSGSRSGAGVQVADARGRTVSDIRCAEVPYMFPAYLQSNLPCDAQNPHGAAACKENPYTGK